MRGAPIKYIFYVVVLVAAVAVRCGPAEADITQAQLRTVEVSPPQGAQIPATVTATDIHGTSLNVRSLIDRPTIFIFSDYTCTTLCGPILSFVAGALDQTGLKPGKDFNLIVMGLDPKDSAADAETMRKSRIGDDPALSAATTFLIADAAQVKSVTAALGYHYVYDAANDQFAHPAAAYVLAADGHVVHVIAGVGLSGDDMRLALVEAGKGAVGTITDQIHLLCYGFDVSKGAYNLAVSRILAITGLLTMVTLGGGIGFLIYTGARPRA
jgi:protein SCO1/2